MDVDSSLSHKKLSLDTSGTTLNFISLKDYGLLKISITSTGDNCLIINGSSSCEKKVSIKKNPFKGGVKIPFRLAKKGIGQIFLNIELCSLDGKCMKKNLSLQVIPKALKKITLTLPKEQKLLAGAYYNFPIQAFDEDHNPITRTLESYKLEVNKGKFIVGGEEKNQIEIHDFQNTKILYRANLDQKGSTQFTIKTNEGKVLNKQTAEILQGNLTITQNNQEVHSLHYQLKKDPQILKDQKGNRIINRSKIIPLTLALKDKQGKTLPLNLSVAFKTINKKLTPVSIQHLKNEKNQLDEQLAITTSLTLEKGEGMVYLLPHFKAGEDIFHIAIP